MPRAGYSRCVIRKIRETNATLAATDEQGNNSQSQYRWDHVDRDSSMTRAPITDAVLHRWYERRIGEAATTDDVRGYWLFSAGVIAGMVGLVIFASTEAATVVRGISYAVAGLAPVLIMLGAVIRFPLTRPARYLAFAGGMICMIAIGWLIAVFPTGWPSDTGNFGVIVTYMVGLTLIGFAGAIVPLIGDPVRADDDRLQEAAAPTTDRFDHQQAHDHPSGGLVVDVDRDDSVVGEPPQSKVSQAQFELYRDAREEYRWRLRHRNGRIIADSGEGYASKQKCRQGLKSVRQNAPGAGVRDLSSDQADDVDAS